MYAIQITNLLLSYRNGELEEWAIVELQGDLKFDSADVTNKYIGDLHFLKSGVPIFIIGIHVLHGKEIALPKPLAVLVKKHNEEADTTNSEIKTEYVIKAIVKKKLLFRLRPKPIVTNVPKSN